MDSSSQVADCYEYNSEFVVLYHAGNFLVR